MFITAIEIRASPTLIFDIIKRSFHIKASVFNVDSFRVFLPSFLMRATCRYSVSSVLYLSTFCILHSSLCDVYLSLYYTQFCFVCK